ncbi:MAG: hypothetical protein E3J23_08480 [Candidatus Stahlbacteria bacterium]|nr:MAG: hypothetical protein E3J23_08480 [Candidatus Stahlbacteria bacterium]
MNEVKERIIKGWIVYKSDLLKSPDKYRDKNIICFEFGEEYLNTLNMFSGEIDFTKPFEVILHPWPEEITGRAKRFFFTLRDRICKASGDESKEYKEHIYQTCIESLLLRHGDGFKNSISQLNKQELWQATEIMLQWCFEADAYIGDLQTEYYTVKVMVGK